MHVEGVGHSDAYILNIWIAKIRDEMKFGAYYTKPRIHVRLEPRREFGKLITHDRVLWMNVGYAGVDNMMVLDDLIRFARCGVGLVVWKENGCLLEAKEVWMLEEGDVGKFHELSTKVWFVCWKGAGSEPPFRDSLLRQIVNTSATCMPPSNETDDLQHLQVAVKAVNIIHFLCRFAS